MASQARTASSSAAALPAQSRCNDEDPFSSRACGCVSLSCAAQSAPHSAAPATTACAPRNGAGPASTKAASAGSPLYLTRKGKDQTYYVYQRRVPKDLCQHFGRTVIRRGLGHVSEEMAIDLARTYAQLHDDEFAKLREDRRGTEAAHRASEAPPLELLAPTPNLNAQLAATARALEAPAAESELRALAAGDGVHDSMAWGRAIAECEKSLRQARDDLRLGREGPTLSLIKQLRLKYRVYIADDPGSRTLRAEAVNASRVRHFQCRLQVLRGEAGASTLHPDRSELIPLADLWGTSADTLVNRWLEERRKRSGEPKSATQKKYEQVARDLAKLLRRRNCESLSSGDLDALHELWAQPRVAGRRACQARTIRTQMGILRALLRTVLRAELLQALFAGRTSTSGDRRGRRRAFNHEELQQFFDRTFGHSGLSVDQKHFPALLYLSGMRVEELAQLRITDLSRTGYGWIIRLSERGRLKTDASVRDVPIRTELLPGIDRWISERAESGQTFLFHSFRPTREGKRGSATSKRLNGLIRDLVGSDPRLVLQSLRQTSFTHLRQAKEDLLYRHRIAGHTESTNHATSYEPGESISTDELVSCATVLAERLAAILEGRAAMTPTAP